MKSLLIVGLMALDQLAWAGGNKWSLVKCESLDQNAKFTIEFVGHPTEQKTLTVTYRTTNGSELVKWLEPINGFAERGFIKISQAHKKTSPFSRIWTNIIAFPVEVGVNEPFPASHEEYASTPWAHNILIASYKLTCVSPY